ncbi:MAG: hypothetical protein IPM64_14560 [Phycisphaerales bacterium]|nr:hypothetical protein [Phycisphaerales bacterium]
MPVSDSSREPTKVAAPLAGREIVVCVSGGIAAYKTAFVVSGLVQSGAGVTVCMTRNARRFITPLTFRALTARPVLTSAWETSDGGSIEHLRRSESADLILVAPATANVIGKLASGIADDLVSALLLGAACPVVMAPAMNTRMWEHAAVRRNIDFLRNAGVRFVGPGEGWLACRAVGAGRMSEPDDILAAVQELIRTLPSRGRSTIAAPAKGGS